MGFVHRGCIFSTPKKKGVRYTNQCCFIKPTTLWVKKRQWLLHSYRAITILVLVYYTLSSMCRAADMERSVPPCTKKKMITEVMRHVVDFETL